MQGLLPMKTQFVSMLQEGDKVNDYFVAARKDLRTMNNGGKFLGMVFRDKTGEVGGIMWNNAAEVARLFEVGDVVNVRGTVGVYQDRLQVRADAVLPLKENEYRRDDLVATPDDAESDIRRLREILAEVQNPHLRALVDAFLTDTAFMEEFSHAAAGKKWHHAYPGGLAKHCYEIARIVVTMVELFPTLNKDLLLTGVLVHDIGKLEEMSHDMLIDYTTAGKLVGHLELGADMVRKKMDGIEGFPEKLRLEVLHLILSHHGELVNGSPVVPKTPEAIVLHLADNLDAQTDAFMRVVEETRERGEYWSEYLPLIERQIWTRGR